MGIGKVCTTPICDSDSVQFWAIVNESSGMCKQMSSHIKKRMNRISECILFDRSLKELKKNVMELRLSYA